MNIVGLIACWLAVVTEATNVIQLNDRNFSHDTQIGEGMTTGPWFIKFYAPWCGHCRRLAPIWERVVDDLKEDQINVAEVDCVLNKKICARFDVPAYPTLIYFKDNKMYKYRGTRDQTSLTNFAREAYKGAEFSDVPVPLTLWAQLLVGLEGMAMDLEAIYEGKKAAAAALIVLGLSIGAMAGASMTMYCSSRILREAKRAEASASKKKS